MSWQDRLRPPSYESPSGKKITFIYEDVSKQTLKHTTAFEFADQNGTFVQSQGRSGRRLPLRIIFSGDDYDLQANTFDAMLDEDGVGVLEHPVYGRFDVVVFGEISRQDLVKSRGNQAVFNVTFFETNGLTFPLPVDSAADALQTAIDAFLEVSPEQFANTLDRDSIIENVSLRDRYDTVVKQVKSGLDAVAAVQEEIKSAFDTVFQSINDAIDVFIDDPLALGFQTGILMQLPARSIALIASRLDAYGNLLVSITTNGQIYAPGLDAQPNNSFRNDDLFASNLLMGSAASVLNNDFETKQDALSAAEILLEGLDAFTIWRDTNIQALGIVDSGEVYQKVIDGISIAAGFLVEISFSLKQERSVILVTATTPIELEARYYGTLDENLDFLIQSNALVGEEILEVPIGRKVVYYT